MNWATGGGGIKSPSRQAFRPRGPAPDNQRVKGSAYRVNPRGRVHQHRLAPRTPHTGCRDGRPRARPQDTREGHPDVATLPGVPDGIHSVLDHGDIDPAST